MNANRFSFDFSNHNKKEIRRKTSYFWNTRTTCETIDNKNLSEIGTNKQKTNKIVNTNDELTTSKHSKNNIFVKFFKKVNDIFAKSSSINQNLTGSENKANNEKSIKHSQSMMELQNKKRLVDEKLSKRISLFTSSNNVDTLLSPSLSQPLAAPQIKSDKNELNEWKDALMNELDAAQYEIKYNKLEQTFPLDLKGNDNDCNELVINTLQPSGMENNKNVNQYIATTLDAKLGVISRKTMIDDWLHYNSSIPESATFETPVLSYLQHYRTERIGTEKTRIEPADEKKKNPREGSLLSAQFKREGKERYDHVKERLEIAAARRNAIKTNRLKEQMDTALFETIHMLRESHDINNQQTILQQQNVEDWLFSIDKKSERRTYLSSASEATMSTYLSNDYHLSIEGNKHEEDIFIW